MNLSDLTKIKSKSKKRAGLGHGSGRGKTAGRGMKGQKSRSKVPLDFEGGALPLIKRLPFLRGKGRNKALKLKKLVINIGALNIFSKNATVDIETLIGKKLIDPELAKKSGVKVLGDGDLNIPLNVKLPVSKGAEKKIKKAGGSVIA